jgi:serine/threonine protein kinase
MAILTKVQLEQYHYGIDVQRGRQLYGMSGKKLYFGQWITRRADPIIIVDMNEEIAQREAFFYRELNGHDHIIRTLGYVENNLNLTIFVQEYAQRGDLSNLFMDNIINITQTMLIEIFSQVADAMSYVASKSIVHGDLGCRNILVYKIESSDPKNILVKITDFGLARSSDCLPSLDEETTPIIPVRYCAPEILQDDYRSNYSEKSDVYSMGVLMWEALSNGEMPYSSIADDLSVKQMKLDQDTLIRPSNCDRKLWILMENCWTFDPKERINFEQIKELLSDIHISDLTEIQILISSFE